MPEPQYDYLQHWNPVFQGIGRIVYHWNNFERNGVTLLNEIIGAGHKAVIATAHMGTNAQLDALRTIAVELLSGEERECVVHFVKLYERLRERRNFYVHSFQRLTIDLERSNGKVRMRPGTNHGGLSGIHAKGRLKQTTGQITKDELFEESQLMQAATSYAALLVCHFKYPDNPDYGTLPEKFPLPDRLTKQAKFVLADRSPPRSSEA